ncbi:MAG TPA: phospholipase A [Paraburkholderia sp.]
MLCVVLWGFPRPASAGVSVLRPPREATTLAPLEVTLVYSGDQPAPIDIDVPEHLDVTLTNGDVPPRRVTLMREPGVPDRLSLANGELKAVRFRAPWPDWARGALRIDVLGMDASPSTVLLTRNHALPTATPPAGEAVVAAPAGAQSAQQMVAAPPSAPAPSVPDVDHFLGGRLSEYEPIYFMDGAGSHGETIARFQLSFKFRLVLPDDPRSRGFLDNLYLAYTQTALWYTRKLSAPFRDTSYMPQVFYYLPDTGWKSSLFTRMGFMAGFFHDSNGQDGPESRAIDTVFVRPTWDFGDLSTYHLTVSPKIFYYVNRAGENHDIADYLGYVDLLVKYGSPDGWQLATTLRKGTKSWNGSVDAQLTYPLARLLGNAWGGYLMFGYFNGYGEDILGYNEHRWIARIGYALTR